MVQGGTHKGDNFMLLQGGAANGLLLFNESGLETTVFAERLLRSGQLGDSLHEPQKLTLSFLDHPSW